MFGSESKFESSVRQIPFSQEKVFAKLSDLNNLEIAIALVSTCLQ